MTSIRGKRREVAESQTLVAPALYDYTDYRVYLLDWYHYRRRVDRSFSYRRLAQEVGFKSAGHFSLILKAKANLSLRIMDRFIRCIGLVKKDAEYFQAMVLYTQAKAHEEKKRYFERMLSFGQFRDRSLDASQYEFLEKWYYTAVREVLAIHAFKGDYRALAHMVEPPLTVAEARDAIDTLKRLNLIARDAQGIWQRVDTVLKAGADVGPLAVQNFLVQTLDLAKRALDHIPREERVMSATSISVSRRTFEEIREEVSQFRKRLLEAARRDPLPDRIYQFQFHVFPLSKSADQEGGT